LQPKTIEDLQLKRSERTEGGFMSVFVGLTAMMFFVLTSWFSIANATSVLTEQEAAKTLKIQYTTDNHEVISGKITNESPHAIKDPELLVEYHWLWAKEFHPGQHSPGRAAYVSSTRKFSLVRPLILLTDRNLLCPIGMMVGLCRKCRRQVFRLSCRRSALLHVRKPEDASLIFTSIGDVNGPGSLDRPVANYCF